MKKNDCIELSITDLSVNGEGIGHVKDCAFFVKNALPGDVVKAVITKMKKGYGYAKVLEILTPSFHRISPACRVSGRCGGCQIMELAYSEQLRLKEEKVRNNLERIGGFPKVPMQSILGMKDDPGHPAMPLHFRNKVQFPLGYSRDGRLVAGFYAGRTHYIIETEDCPVAAPEVGILMETICRFLEENHISAYHEETGSGLVRHVLIRSAFSTGQTLVCLVINGETLEEGSHKAALGREWPERVGSHAALGEEQPKKTDCQAAAGVAECTAEQKLVQALLSADLQPFHTQIAGICLNVNTENTNVILGKKIIPLYGNLYLEDCIGTLRFRISPLAFFQVNSFQTETLYEKVLEYAGLTGNETVWDLYCGTGTISLFLAQKARRVCGVEIIPAAIENARENAELNGISNVRFYCGKSEEIFPALCGRGIVSANADRDVIPCEEQMHVPAAGSGAGSGRDRPDVVVLDPPRKGCAPELLEAILTVLPEKIVYVSCDSATLARDLRILGSRYHLTAVQPVDMFPHTCHVETVCLLSNTQGKKKESYITLDVEMEDYYRIKNEGKNSNTGK